MLSLILSLFRISLQDNGIIFDSFTDPLLVLETLKQKMKEGTSSYALAAHDIKMPKMKK